MLKAIIHKTIDTINKSNIKLREKHNPHSKENNYKIKSKYSKKIKYEANTSQQIDCILLFHDLIY